MRLIHVQPTIFFIPSAGRIQMNFSGSLPGKQAIFAMPV
jgi:hypothetical protein